MSENHIPMIVETVSGSEKVVANDAISHVNVDIPIIPVRDHAIKEVTIEVVRVRKPVQIDTMSIKLTDAGGYMIELPGGKVKYSGAYQTVFVDDMPSLINFISSLMGQTTYEYFDMEKDDYECTYGDKRND